VHAALREAEALVTTWDSPRFGEELVALARGFASSLTAAGR